MNNIEFYRNLTEIMAIGLKKNNGSTAVNNNSTSEQTSNYTSKRPNEESAVIKYNSVTKSEGTTSTPKTDSNTNTPAGKKEAPSYYFTALENGLLKNVKNNNEELFPQLEILADEFLEEFCNASMDKNGEPIAENMVAIIKNLVSGSLASYSADYIKKNKDLISLDMEKVAINFNDFITEKLNTFSEQQIEAGEYIEKLKGNEGKTLEDLSTLINNAKENNYITTSEAKKIKTNAQEYIINSTLNETPNAKELLKLLKPGYETNTSYTKALDSIKNAKRYEDAGDLINAQASYRDAQKKIDDLLATVPVEDIAKSVAQIKGGQTPPPPPEEKPDTPAQPTDNIKAYTDEISKIADDAAKAYEKITDKDKKEAAKVLLDSINQYKENALTSAKDADNAKTDDQKALLNQKLNGYKELINGFVTDFNTIADVKPNDKPGDTPGTKPDDWTREKATTDITKAYDDAKAVYDAMADGPAKIAANSYLRKIEQSKNRALELLKAEKGDEAAEKALKETIGKYNGFITEMSGKIDTLAGKVNNGETPPNPPAPGVDDVTPEEFAQQEIKKPEVKNVFDDCNNFITAYNKLTPEQQATLKPKFDAVQDILAKHKKYTDGSLKTIDDMKANTTDITSKAAEAKTALDDANALVNANENTNKEQAIRTACQNALQNYLVTSAVDDANSFIATYNTLTPEQQASLSAEYEKAQQILTNKAALENNTPASTEEVAEIENAITGNATAVKEAKGTAETYAAQNAAALTAAQVKEASDAALTDPKVISSYETAKEFMKIYDTLPDEIKSTLSDEHINAQNAISRYEQLRDYKSDRVTVVNAVKSSLIGYNSSLINDLGKIQTVANATNIALALSSLNNDPIVIKAIEDMDSFTKEYNKASDDVKKDPKVIAAYDKLQKIGKDFLDKLTNGKFATAEEVTNIHTSLVSASEDITQALKDLKDAMIIDVPEIPNIPNVPVPPDPQIKQVVDTLLKQKIFEPMELNVNSFMQDYEELLDDEQRSRPEVVEMYDFMKKMQDEFDKYKTYNFKKPTDIGESLILIQKSIATMARYAQEIKGII